MRDFFGALGAITIVVVGAIGAFALILIANPFFWLAVIALILVIKL